MNEKFNSIYNEHCEQNYLNNNLKSEANNKSEIQNLNKNKSKIFVKRVMNCEMIRQYNLNGDGKLF